jgi:beta-mannosidase
MDVSQGWEFSRSGPEEWHPATVPGTVHTDLFNNRLIEDPFFGENEKQVQWIENEDWIYRTSFGVDRRLLEADRVDLVCEGLDTYADVFLNDSLILSACNMFRTWRVDVKDLLLPEGNSLRVVLHSPIKEAQPLLESLPYQLPDDRAVTRKAPYQYGWDWGPRLVTSGIWKPVFLEAYNDIRLAGIFIRQGEVSEEKAQLALQCTLESSRSQTCLLTVSDVTTGKELGTKEEQLASGVNTLSLDVAISDPHLWWTNGLGKPFLYDLVIRAETKRHFDADTLSYGIRTLELVREPDSAGSSFYFKLNGVPVFMKGANYIPRDNFPPSVSSEDHLRLIRSAADANMNMLRVWGGGIYEDDLFYSLCDRYGILVWQDFMFACNLYPGDSAFLNNVAREAEDNISRLRNHPCLALWCGNNEISEGWHNWGWQKQLGYTREDSVLAWKNYLALFEDLLPRLVSENDPGRPYWPSSPSIGWGRPESLKEGDSHYWGVWWGEEPFDVYKKKVGRFMSEYGFQGFPDERTIAGFALPADRNLRSPALLNHQKHPRGMELINTYMERDFRVPDDFGDYAYISQLVQAYGIQTAVEAHRRARPYCMGTLYWQLNDCWPVISWSSLDYYGRWKALHYFIRKAYRDVLVSVQEEGGILKVYACSDRPESFTARLSLRLLDFSGRELKKENRQVEVERNAPVVVYRISTAELLGSSRKNEVVFSAGLADEKGNTYSGLYYFVPVKELNLPAPSVKMRYLPAPKGYRVELSTSKLAKNVFLQAGAQEGFFTNNYFDLLPGERAVVDFITDRRAAGEDMEIRLTTVADTYRK